MRGATRLNDVLIESVEFQSTRPVRGATIFSACGRSFKTFQSTRPVRGATGAKNVTAVISDVSIHAPRAGRDRRPKQQPCAAAGFNPRAPCGARRTVNFSVALHLLFQSTRPVRGATAKEVGRPFHGFVSIHAPRAGRDARQQGLPSGGIRFNPRAPCGARLDDGEAKLYAYTFQSTRPVRGATAAVHLRACTGGCFNPRAPCGARPTTRICRPSSRRFNPRAPCGARRSTHMDIGARAGFNPRAPCGARHPVKPCNYYIVSVSIHAPRAGRDALVLLLCIPKYVSIHAPRAGRDLLGAGIMQRRESFNPRAPCGARRGSLYLGAGRYKFQSTRPVRGATGSGESLGDVIGVSIHAPRAGRDAPGRGNYAAPGEFQSTRPVRGATAATPQGDMSDGVSIHAPRAGRDSSIASLQNVSGSFNPRAPCGARPG
ncbi:hypothetical protein HMPREF9162_2208 [Selenomonas sp. oral taxon 137 str. F0430]|nr:hypothetical protein HMPREF9162_2208 [Selenomonas sp. oral taxon 137 str. F0430]